MGAVGNCKECGKTLGDPRSTYCRTHSYLMNSPRPKRTKDQQRAADRERERKRYAEDPEYRARKKQAADRRRMKYDEGNLTQAEWDTLLVMYNHTCAYCLSPAEVMDHVVPLANEGSHDASNVVPACKACNLSKGDKSLIEWGGR